MNSHETSSESTGQYGQDFNVGDMPEFQGDQARQREVLEKESREIIKDFLKDGTIDAARQYDQLVHYAELRKECLGCEKPVNVLWRVEFFDSQARIARFDPVKQAYFRKPWNWSTHAYHSDEGTFLDFPIRSRKDHMKPIDARVSAKLEGYEAASSIIDFAYTLEHELAHEVQNQWIKDGVMDYDTLRTTKDHLLLSTLGKFEGTSPEYFYTNAHNDLFIEMDANNSADILLGDIISADYDLSRKVVYGERTMQDILDSRARTGKPLKRDYKLELGENSLNMPQKTYEGTAEEIVSDYCDDLIAMHPDLIRQYPALSLEYNNDGTRRTRESIEGMYDLAKHQEAIFINGIRVSSLNIRQSCTKLLKESRKLKAEAQAEGRGDG